MNEVTVAVVGAGRIGRSVAQALAEHAAVVLIDSHAAALDSARTEIRRDQLSRALRGQAGIPAEQLLARIRCTTDLGAAGAGDLVVENVTEDADLKLVLHSDLAGVVAPHAVVAANTSAVPIGHLAAAHQRPERLLGIHFMIPVPSIHAVELIRGAATSDASLRTAAGLLNGWGFRTIEVNDAPGFVANRVLMLMVNEAFGLLRTAVAGAEAIDAVFTECNGHRLGPLATADLIGLDTVLRTLHVLRRFTDDPRFGPDALLTEYVAAGRLGRKSGHGVFRY